MLEKTLVQKDSFNELIELALSKKGIYVLSIGPPGCLRVLFFRAMRAELLEQYFSFAIKPIDVISASYEDRLIEHISKMISEKREMRGLILYLSCSEILTGMKFEKTQRAILEKYNMPVYVFKRGPFAKRTGAPREKMKELISKINEYL
ncbi:hypothetical protein [Dehalobacterium formicoaceticum]|uniref:Uncharacterized protein n=1 Tax=Dehalobacterium formicoaceticum TaxID=51515 RepID=A0ABT1Y9Z2_9FIRM|nr:hypothetical protein [Dehalobacterium formicoaceticum]MCR6546925.1 hypothetical protein [Dehalobacterium formicoaceticum]